MLQYFFTPFRETKHTHSHKFLVMEFIHLGAYTFLDLFLDLIIIIT
jgi:hypothetical protein